MTNNNSLIELPKCSNIPKRIAGYTPMNLMQRNPVTADRPYHVTEEFEPNGNGGIAHTTTVFLTASECPIRCTMCDLWKNTLTVPTPPGAIVQQIDWALRENRTPGLDADKRNAVLESPLLPRDIPLPESPPESPSERWLKLYNSGNFFDPRSIPPSDHDAIIERCHGFDRIVIENHPKFGSSRLSRFKDRLTIPLEIAVGLETVQPRWLDRFGKQMTRDDFDRYAKILADQDIDLRVFLIIGVPGITVAESLRWTRLSIRHAIRVGARHISLIPLRPSSHPSQSSSSSLPRFTTQSLLELQQAALEDAASHCVVTMDLWDIPPHAPHLSLLHQRNLTQRIETKTQR